MLQLLHSPKELLRFADYIFPSNAGTSEKLPYNVITQRLNMIQCY